MSDINTSSVSDMDTPNVKPGDSADAGQDVNLNDAFLSLADKWENGTSSEDVENSSANQEINQSEDIPKNSTQSQTSETVLDQLPTDKDTSDTNTKTDEDYRQLYEQALRERDVQNAQLGLLYSRLGDLSDKYQELKLSQSSTQDVKQTMPTEVQELYDIYPDIAKAVEKLIESKISSTEEGIKKELEPKTAQVQQQLQQVAAQSYVNRVLSVHPDTMQLVQSNALRKWIDTLEPLQKTGADYIMKYGSADDVIGLISRYKVQIKPSVKTTTSTQSSEDDLVKKVIAAMSVASNKQEPSTVKPKVEEYTSTEDAFNALAKKYEAGLK